MKPTTLGLFTYPWASECPDVKNYKWRLNPVWHRMLYTCRCTQMATVGVKGSNWARFMYHSRVSVLCTVHKAFRAACSYKIGKANSHVNVDTSWCCLNQPKCCTSLRVSRLNAQTRPSTDDEYISESDLSFTSADTSIKQSRDRQQTHHETI